MRKRVISTCWQWQQQQVYLPEMYLQCTQKELLFRG